MRTFVAISALLAGGVFAQPVAPPVGRTIELDPARPKEVVAVVDGVSITAEEFQQLTVALDPKTREATRNNAVEVLRYYGWLRHMGQEAEKRGLPSDQLLRLQLEMARIQLLSNAVIQQHELDDVVTPFEQRGHYQSNQSLYTGVKLKLIYLPFTNETEELQVKRRMEEIHKKLKAGANFVALVKEHSKDQESREKDGDYGEVRMGDQIPQTVKDVAFALKDGEFSAPTRLANGYYLFLRTGMQVDPYDKVKDQIFIDLKQKRNAEWVAKQRDAVTVTLKKAAGNDPKRVVATLDGQDVTAADLDMYLNAMEEKLRNNLRDNPEEVLRGMGFMRRMAKLAEEKKLDKTAPYSKQLELTRLQALANALIRHQEQSTTVSDAELKQVYQENLKYVSLAKLKIIFFSVEQENEAGNMAALELAKEVHEKIKGGADFVELVKQYSKDPVSRDKNGDYGPLKTSDEIPVVAKQAIWALEPGQVSAPVKLPNGYYIFKLLAYEAPPLEQVREQMTKTMRTVKNKEWLRNMGAQVQVRLVERKPEAAK